MSFGDTPLNLTVEVAWSPKLRPTGWSHLTIEEASDSTGKALTLKRSGDAEKVNEFRPKFRKENVSDIRVGLSEPDRAATNYSAKGSIVLHIHHSISFS